MNKQKPKKPKPKRRIEVRPIDSLKPHPSQAKIFPDLNDVELRLLADDIKKNRLLNPVEILPDGTIIAGHQRIRAARLLGWTKIRCWIREDLEQQGDEAIETRLIEDNMNRRQLSCLGIARCYLRLKELEKDGWNTREDNEGDLRDHLAKRFNLSGRQLDRYAKMLKTPPIVQFAFERNQLTQNQVLAVARLEADEQRKIAKSIEKGKVPVEVVKPYMQRTKATAVRAETAVFRLVSDLEKAAQQLKGRWKDISGIKLALQIGKLASGQRFIEKLQKHIMKAKNKEASNHYRMLDEFESRDE